MKKAGSNIVNSFITVSKVLVALPLIVCAVSISTSAQDLHGWVTYSSGDSLLVEVDDAFFVLRSTKGEVLNVRRDQEESERSTVAEITVLKFRDGVAECVVTSRDAPDTRLDDLAVHFLSIGKRPVRQTPNPVPVDDESGDLVYTVVDVFPELIGGLEGLQKRIRYPDEARRNGQQGQVMITFIVDEQGNVQNPTISRSSSALLNDEALRVISTARFTAPIKDGIPVKMQFALPIRFRLRN
jgi:TonB family protein